MQLSFPEQFRQTLPDIPYGDQMVTFLRLIHPLRGQHTNSNLLLKEVIDEGSSNPIVKELLLHRIEPLLFRMGLDQLPQGLPIDVVIHLPTNHGLV